MEATAFVIPAGSTGYWLKRLQDHKVTTTITQRFGDEVLRFADPDGLIIELVASTEMSAGFPFTGSSVPEAHVIRGLHGVTAALDHSESSARLLTETFGYQRTEEAGNRARYLAPGPTTFGKAIDLVTTPGAFAGRSGAGTVHHIAFRVATANDQLAWQKKLADLGYRVSPVMDRTYFQSIYFREPAGILFEIATDVPGFTADEAEAELGSTLRLPSWMERSRARIEAVLPAITMPNGIKL